MFATTSHNDDTAPSSSSFSCPVVLELLGLIEQGAALIEAKHYKQSGICLTRALQINKDMLVLETMAETCEQAFKNQNHDEEAPPETARRGQQPSCCDVDDHHHDDEALSSSHLCHQVLDLVIGTNSNCDMSVGDRSFTNVDHDDDEDYFWLTSRRSIYAHSVPLVLMPSNQLFDLMETIPMQEFQLTLSLIIIYNLALSQHLYGICQMKKGSSSHSTLLDRAFSLYRYSYTLLHQLRLETCWFLGLAIVNNEAHILSILGKHREAEERLQAILSGLCCLNPCFADNQEGFLPKSFLEGLVHNVSHLILKEAATASAA